MAKSTRRRRKLFVVRDLVDNASGKAIGDRFYWALDAQAVNEWVIYNYGDSNNSAEELDCMIMGESQAKMARERQMRMRR